MHVRLTLELPAAYEPEIQLACHRILQDFKHAFMAAPVLEISSTEFKSINVEDQNVINLLEAQGISGTSYVNAASSEYEANQSAYPNGFDCGEIARTPERINQLKQSRDADETRRLIDSGPTSRHLSPAPSSNRTYGSGGQTLT